MYLCQHIQTFFMGYFFFALCPFLLHTRVSEFFFKSNTYTLQMWLVKNATFAKKRGKYILPQMFAERFVHPDLTTKRSQILLLTHIHSILYPLEDVKGVLHIALEDVKPDIVTNCRVVGAVSRHGGSQEDDLCWERINKYQSFWNGRDTLGLQCRFWASFWVGFSFSEKDDRIVHGKILIHWTLRGSQEGSFLSVLLFKWRPFTSTTQSLWDMTKAVLPLMLSMSMSDTLRCMPANIFSSAVTVCVWLLRLLVSNSHGACVGQSKRGRHEEHHGRDNCGSEEVMRILTTAGKCMWMALKRLREIKLSYGEPLSCCYHVKCFQRR